jgi:anti-sigma factor RsiW
LNDHELTHERCSELLAAFADGRLETEETVRVEAHVATCADCSAELRSIMFLRAGDDPMTDLERARLRRGVSASLGDVIAPAREPSRLKVRLAAALGAAALLAVFGVAIVSLGTGGGDDEEAAATAEGSDRNPLRDEGAGGGAGAAGDTGVGQDAAAAPLPRPSYDDDAGRLSGRKLRRIGERSAALKSFGLAYSADDAAALKDEYVSDLAEQAETPVDNLILNCAEEVYEAQPYAALPAFAAKGTLEGRRALVLGFAWTEQESGPLDQFMLWTWPQSSCDQPIDYRAGRIAPRK